MRKFTLALMALLALTFTVKAQQYVSTEPTNRNVILEEFTGRGCGYCTDGHRIANQIMAANPGRVWAINIHAGGYAQTSYPNMITTDGNTIHGGFSISGYPTGVVNRTTAAGIDRGQWTGQANTQMNQASECNIAGIAMVNPDTRVATITVEVYYTSNSLFDENYLTVAMLQDSILGSQSDYGNYNPTQWLNGQYVHMHILRDVITSSAWGDPISPTTQGTLITRTFEYPIPETIGSPNGVDVDLNNIFFLAWVSEHQQGNAYRPILTGCELDKSTMTNEPIYPSMSSVSQSVGASCSHTQSFSFGLSNIGTNEITSIHFSAEAGDVTESFDWNGSLPSGDKTNVEFTMDLPFGNYDAMLNIEEVNGEPYEAHRPFNAECLEWAGVSVDADVTTLKVIVVSDAFGEQTTWNIINSAGEEVATGGPYQHVIGTGTNVNMENVEVPVNDCYLFRIYDSNGNGICCNYGNGYYQIKNASGTVIIDGDGSFGEEAKHLISVTNPNAVTVATVEPRILGDHEVMFIGTIAGAGDEVGFEYKKLVNPEPMTVMGELNGDTFTATVDDLDAGTMYTVKAFAMVGGNKVYGQSIDFHTWFEGVSELENTLKVYPNPANDILTVEGTMTSIEVYNTVGQCMLSKQVNGNTQIDLSGFNNGIYFLRVYNDGEMVVRKFSVNR
ncbi:MAG: Omp28-related outer membrane protein [Bacteroidales bacterium]|nr:Omp28-related outer membrane protein [Bacteroidales bacterium]